MVNNYKKQKGIILPVVLIFFSVLMLLGVSFVSMSGFQAIQSESQVDRTQAYYLAKSGAHTVSDYIINYVSEHSVSNTKEMIQSIANKQPEFAVGDGKVKITIQQTPDRLTIESTGTVNDSESIVYSNLRIVEVEGSSGETEEEIIQVEIITNDITIVGLNNSIYNKLKNDYPVQMNNSVFKTPEKFPVIFKDYSTNNFEKISELNINNDVYINADSQINTINLNRNLYIDLNNSPKILVVDRLIVGPSGRIILKNVGDKGQLILQINTLMEINGNGGTFGSPEDDKVLQIFVNDKAIIKPSNCSIYSNLFIKPGGNVIFENGVNYYGLIYAPKSHLVFQNNDLYAAIVAQNLTMMKNASKIYPSQKYFDVIDKVIEVIKPKYEIFYDENPWN